LLFGDAIDRHSRDIVGWGLDETTIDRSQLAARRDPCTAASQQFGTPYRPWWIVCQRSSPRSPALRRHAAEHEATRQLQRQCLYGISFGTLKTESKMTEYEDCRA
jgi:hypothetical protein